MKKRTEMTPEELETIRKRSRDSARAWREKNRDKHLSSLKEQHKKRKEAGKITLYNRREDVKARRKQWQKDNAYRYIGRKRENNRGCQFKSRYGITLEQWEQMNKEQNGACAICSKVTDLVVDHNHDTGAVRSLLCHRCNHLLGHSLESIETLQNAISYLTRFQAPEAVTM